MRGRLLIFLVLGWWCSGEVLAQEPADTLKREEKYLEELLAFIRKPQDQRTNELAEQFEKHWTKLPAPWRASIRQVFDAMGQLEMSVVPYYRDYLAAVVLFLSPECLFPDERFEEWNQVAYRILTEVSPERKARQLFREYMNTMEALFSQRALFASPARTWQIDTMDIQIKFADTTVILRVPPTTLRGITINDTLEIHNTSGVFNVLTKEWRSPGGVVYWVRAGFSMEDAYTKLPPYSFELSKGEYKVDSAILYNRVYLKDPLTGAFVDKMVAFTAPEESKVERRRIYPQFVSYQQNVELTTLAPNTYFRGGIGFKGVQMVGIGTEESPCVFEIYRGDSLFIRVVSTEFLIKPGSLVVSDAARITIYLTSHDSIEHPGVTFRYLIAGKTVEFVRGSQGLSAAPFYDSYHQLELEPEIMWWRVGSDTLALGVVVGAGKTPVHLYSTSFFHPELFERYMQALDYNPISKLAIYVKERKDRWAYEETIAKFFNPRLSVEAVRPLLFKLAEEGFIDYDPETGTIFIKDKAIFYSRAYGGTEDYDVIRITSLCPEKQYGYILLNTLDLVMEGVDYVVLSVKRNAAIVPRDKRIIIKGNREIYWDGGAVVGFAELRSRSLTFNYNKFSISAEHIDSLLLRIPTGEYDARGMPVTVALRSWIEDLRGEVFIDAPQNKSGRYKLLEYPILRSVDTSYVFYDRQDIQNGAYKRNTFHYKVAPFVLDSLYAFDPRSLAFEGVLISAGIFPPVHEPLVVRADLSLGFVTETPPQGLPAYGGRGTFTGTIDLSNKGLWGSGAVGYLSSVTESDSILFLPDRMRTIASAFKILPGTYEGTSYPETYAEHVEVEWVPDSNKMRVASIDLPIELYGDKALLFGAVLTLSPEHLLGRGKLHLFGARMSSEHFRFREKDFDTDTASFEIPTGIGEQLAIKAPNVKVHFDMESAFGRFISNSAEVLNEFPHNSFKTAMNAFDWYVKERKLTFYDSEGKKALFTSTNPAQEGLAFMGERGTYYLDSLLLVVDGVEHIAVADAHIFPDGKRVWVEAQGHMRTLYNARILADTITRYHHFYNATVDIKSRWSYTATAKYDYVNITRVPQTIVFEKIYTRRDTEYVGERRGRQEQFVASYRTNGEAQITEDEKLELNPPIDFKGTVYLYSPRRWLEFKGYARVNLSYPKVETHWFSFRDIINPDSFRITIRRPQNEAGQYLYSGVNFQLVSYQPYPTVMAPKVEPHDPSIFATEGVLLWDHQRRLLTIGDSARVLGGYPRGKLFRFYDQTGTMHVEGTVDLFSERGGLMNVNAAGVGTYEYRDNSYSFTLTMALDMPLAEAVLEVLYRSVREVTYDVPELNYEDSLVKLSLANLTQEGTELKVLRDIERRGVYKPGDELPHSLLLTGVHFVWDENRKVFYHVGKLGVISIGGKPIHKEMIGYVQLAKKRSGDQIEIYLRTTPENWYYFRYRQKTLEIASSDTKIRKTILELKRKERRVWGENKSFFRVTVCTERSAQEFAQHMEGYMSEQRGVPQP